MLPINEKLTKVNYREGNINRLVFIVIHYVGGVSTAENNANYFYSEYRGASAGYIVDEKSIWRIVKDKDVSFHCGGGLQGSGGHTYYKICTNSNSIGIEMCCKKNSKGEWYFEPETIKNTIELTRYLMDKYNIPAENVIRHYDVVGKICPEPYVRDEQAWRDFKNKLVNNEEEIDMEELNKLKELVAQLQAKLDEHTKTYDWVVACPEWAQPTIDKLYSNGYLKGDENGQLGLAYSDLRILTVLDRAGAFKD